MTTHLEHSISTKVYTTAEGRAVIEQPGGAMVRLSAEEILTVIEELHVCYDYCAVWKEPVSETSP